MSLLYYYVPRHFLQLFSLCVFNNDLVDTIVWWTNVKYQIVNLVNALLISVLCTVCKISFGKGSAVELNVTPSLSTELTSLQL